MFRQGHIYKKLNFNYIIFDCVPNGIRDSQFLNLLK